MGKLKYAYGWSDPRMTYGSRVEWFEDFAEWPEEVYGVLEMDDHWKVMVKITSPFGDTTVKAVTDAPDRTTAIGYIKLLKEE
jgi:hypothetical protein